MKISTLALKNARQSKSVILMIALASMLICAVINLGVSMQKSLVDNVIEYTGDNQAAFTYISQEHADLISERKEVALADTQLFLDGLFSPPDDDRTFIRAIYSSGLGQVANFNIAQGRNAEAVSEAVISPHLAELLGIEPKIGEEFEVIYRAWDADGLLIEETPMKFTVSGVLQEQRLYAAMEHYTLYVSEALAKQNNHDMHLYLRYFNKYEPRATTQLIAEEVGLLETDFRLNEAYLTAGLDDPSVMIGVAVILIILGTAGALVIYNAYNLSVVKKVHQYGLLTVIGASKKQIRRCVYLEALCCAGVGLPLGLLLGTLFGYLGLGALNAGVGYPIVYVINWIAYLISASVTVIMVMIGVLRPARKAARIAPVEAVRFSDAEEKASKRKSVESITLSTLAKINMSRSKKRLVGIILSLSLSGILFLSFSTVAFSMLNSADRYTAQIIAGDIQITAGSGYIDGSYAGGVIAVDTFPIELIDEIRGLDGVVDSTTLLTQVFCDHRTDESGEAFVASGQEAKGVEPEIIQNIIDHVYTGKLTLDDFNDPHNVIAVIPDDDSIEYFERYEPGYREMIEKHAVGSVLDFDILIQDDTNFESYNLMAGDSVSLNVIGHVRHGDIPSYGDAGLWRPMFYMPQENFDKLGWERVYEKLILRVDEEKHDDLFYAIEALCAGNSRLHIESFSRYKSEFSRQLASMIAIVLLMLGVIALNGVMNLIGTTLMNVEQRKKELGVLMAIGLSRKSIGKLLAREGIWVSISCAMLSLVFGLGLGAVLFQLMVKEGATYMELTFPAVPLIALCVVMGVVPYAVTMAATRRLKKATIVELLGRL